MRNDAGVGEALENIREYFDDRADASMEPGDTQFHGNREMALLQDVEIIEGELARLGKAISDGASFALTQRTAEALDAERYRYLRDAAGQWAEDDDGPMVCDGLGDLFDYLRGVEVDESVDRAMAAWKAAGSPIINVLGPGLEPAGSTPVGSSSPAGGMEVANPREDSPYAMDVRAAATRFLDEYRKEFYSGTEGPWSDPPDPLDVAYQALRAALATNTTSSAHARSVSEVARNDSGKPSERMEVSTPHEDTPRSDYALVPPATLAGDWGKALPICRHCGRPLPEGYDEKDCMANPNWASES